MTYETRLRVESKLEKGRFLYLTLLFLVVASALPSSINFVASLVVVFVGIWLSISSFKTQTNITSLIVLAIIIWTTIRIFDTNQPNFITGLTGLRSSIFVYFGFLIGHNWPIRSKSDNFPKNIFILVLIFSTLSLILNRITPSLTEGIARHADKPTHSLFGVERYQGLFSGPFHAAIVGTFLLLAAFEFPKEKIGKITRLTASAVGFLTLLGANTRTGLIASLAGLILLTLSNTRNIILMFKIFVTSLASIGLILMFKGDVFSNFFNSRFVQSLLNSSYDRRFQNRFQSWELARELIQTRPIQGWGTGSGASTMESQYIGYVHIYPHNELLKIIIETGFVGLFLFLCFVLIALLKVISNYRNNKRDLLLVSVTVPLVIFSVFGSSLEALPWSFTFFAILGYGLNNKSVYEVNHKLKLD